MIKLLLLLSLLLATLAAAQDTPTAAPQTNACDSLRVGDFTFLLVSSSDPFDEISFFGFDSLPGGLELYLTDNAWNGETFATAEGVLMFTTPSTGIAAGTIVGVGPASDIYQYGDEWQTVQGAFNLQQEGDQVFLYCLGGNSMPRPIAAISYNGAFVPPNLLDYGTNTSAVPQELLDNNNNGVIVLPPGKQRWYYDGPMNGELNEMKANIQDTNNWVGLEINHDGSGCASDMSAVTAIVVSILAMTTMWM